MPDHLTVNIHKIQYIAIIGSIVVLIGIFELIRQKKLKEEYALLWIFFGIIFLMFSVWRDGLDLLSYMFGIAYPPAMLFLLLIMAIFAILIHYSVIISKLSEDNKTLIQEIGLLRTTVEHLSTQIEARASQDSYKED